MGEVHLTYKGMAEVMFEKAMLDSYTVDRLDKIGYFTAPASKGHHLARPGGLLEHSVNVTRWLERLTEAGVVRWKEPESPYRIGMLHDLVKCKCYAEDPTQTVADGEAVKFVYKNSEWPGHGAASALIAMSEIGVHLSPVECACIVHHMGAFGLDAKQLKEYDAALDVYPREIIATHTTDILAARVDEGGVFQ